MRVVLVQAMVAAAALLALLSCDAVTVPDRPPEPIVLGLRDGGPDFVGFTSLEERIFHSDLVVRGKLRSIEGKARRKCGWSDGRYWMPVVRYEFEAYEFLKGKGRGSLFVNVSFGAWGDSYHSSYEVYESEGGAIAAARAHSRSALAWRGQQAILFIEEGPFWDGKCGEPLPESSDSYSFTLQGDVQAPEYRIDSRFNRVWLPAIDVTSQESERFLLKTPWSAPGHEGQENITLEDLRQRIAELEGSIRRAQSEGVSGYEECLSDKYYRERLNQAAIDAGGELVRHWWQHEVPPPQQRKILFSGVPPSKTVLGEVWEYGARTSDSDLRDKLWLAGPDAHLFRLQPGLAEEWRTGWSRVPHRIIASRVLPGGAYHFQLHRQEAHFQPCDYHDELSAVDYFVEVLPPIEGEEPGAPYANCVMSSAGVLPSEEWTDFAPFSIDSSNQCGSAHRADSLAHYEVFHLNASEEVEVSLTQACPLQQILVFEGIGPNDQPIHVFDPEDFLIGDADLGVLSPGTYTVEVNVPQWAECRSAMVFSWQ